MADDPKTMDIVNPELRGMPESEYHDEINRRTHAAGYTAREGGPIPKKIQNRGYGTKPIKVWPRDEHGDLIGD